MCVCVSYEYCVVNSFIGLIGLFKQIDRVDIQSARFSTQVFLLHFCKFFLAFFAYVLLLRFAWFCLVSCVFVDLYFFLLYFPVYLASSL